MYRMLALVLALGLALLTGCSSASDAMGGAETAARDTAQGEALQGGAPAVADDGAAVERGGEEGGGEGDVQGPAGTAQEPSAALAAAPGDRIVRDGTMRVEVDEAGFDRAFGRVVSAAGRLGGTVLSSEATSDDEGLTSGSVTVRVPADGYDALLSSVAEIGTVRERMVTSEDVSAEFVDLEARLRHNEAQERFYLSLLAEAEGVEDAIAVQQRMDGIQQAIEQIKGRLTFLEERTNFSRLTIELFETGAPFQPGGSQPTFAHYWETARNGLVTVLGGALVIATVATPFVLAGLVIFLLLRRFGPIGRRPQPTAPDS